MARDQKTVLEHCMLSQVRIDGIFKCAWSCQVEKTKCQNPPKWTPNGDKKYTQIKNHKSPINVA